jgi:hypothetical protein
MRYLADKSRSRGRIGDVVHDENGSISPLIIAYFLITLIVVFIGINVTHAYLERRHLILAMESALQRATQQIDDWKYYTGDAADNTLRFRQRGITTFIPIDCNSARRVFSEEFPIQWALSRALNRPDLGIVGQESVRSGSWPLHSNSTIAGRSDLNANSTSTGVGSSSNQSSSIQSSSNRPLNLASIPRITGFQCDGRTVAADAELLVELPFGVSLNGVDLMRFSRQQASVEVGLVFGG